MHVAARADDRGRVRERGRMPVTPAADVGDQFS